MALIKKRMNLDVTRTPGGTGQFDVKVDGEIVVRRGGNVITRSLGMGYPDLEGVVDKLEKIRTNSPNA